MSSANLHDRVKQLEKRTRRLTAVLALGLLAALVMATSATVFPSQEDVLRTRTLVIVDAEGRERVVIGAPVPEPAGQRIAPTTGMVIRDTAGAERFGVGLFPNGNMTMGFDAPPGTGDDRNRERITITASSHGGAELRFLDRLTRVRAHMTLFGDNKVRMFFTDYEPDETIVYRISAAGDTLVRHRK